MLNNETIQTLLQHLVRAESELQNYSPEQPLYNIEAYITLSQIKSHLINPEVSSKKLAKILKRRFDRIQDSNCQYLHDFNNPANSLCIELAIALSKDLNTPYLCLLMPSLSKTSPEHYLTSSYSDEDIKLYDVILSDDKERLINIPDVVDCAQEDGILKHNSLFEKKIKPLSVEEINRLLTRHPSVASAVSHLNSRVLYKFEGDTLGAAVTRLIQGLRMGGVQSKIHYESASLNATDLNSGMDANTAIVDFAQYLETLDAETKKQLMAAEKVDRYTPSNRIQALSIATAWERLSQPNLSNNNNAIYCVEMIANLLEQILETNHHLYDLVSYQSTALGDYAKLNESMLKSNQLMKEQLASVTSHYCFKEKEHEFKKQLLEEMKEQRLTLRLEEVKFIIQMYLETPKDIILANDIQLIFINNHCSHELYKKLSDHEREAYFEFNPKQKVTVSRAQMNGLFIQKRKHEYNEEETINQNHPKHHKQLTQTKTP